MLSRSFSLLALLLVPFLCASIAAPAGAQMTGFVYATDAAGVPADAFSTKEGVYLYAGFDPADGCSGAGLADGFYYFQVTDPSGALLLSSDELSKRRVVVRNGVLAGSLFSSHSSSTGPCGSKLVTLGPLAWPGGETGEFRLWLTPVEQYRSGEGLHGFLPTESLCDGFLLQAIVPPTLPTTIGGRVFYDIDEDGNFDEGLPLEVPIAGWRVELTTGDTVAVTYTDAAGHFEFLRKHDGTSHTLDSIAPVPGYVGEVGGRWLPTSPVQVGVVSDVCEVEVDFGVLTLINTPELARSKGYWHNQGRAELQACDPTWRTVLNDLCLRTNVSNPDGEEGTLFTIPESATFTDAFVALSGYLTGPAHGVLANILSTQFGAANLNKSCGPLHVTAYIDRLGDDVLVSFESMAGDTRTLLCDPRSANTGPHGDEEWRQHVMMCMTEWENMNSSGSNIYSRDTEARPFPTPY